MKKAAIAATSALLVMTAHAAFAKELNGTISHIDTNGDSVTLTDGTTVVLPEEIEAESLKVGEKVVVSYATMKSGKIDATGIRQAK